MMDVWVSKVRVHLAFVTYEESEGGARCKLSSNRQRIIFKPYLYCTFLPGHPKIWRPCATFVIRFCEAIIEMKNQIHQNSSVFLAP